MDQYSPTPGTGGAVPPPLPPPRIAPTAAQPPPPPPGAAPRRRSRFGCLLAVILVVVCAAGLAVIAVGKAFSGAARSMVSGIARSEDSSYRVVEEVISGASLETERKIAVIDIKGLILSEGGSFDMAGSRRIGYELTAARRDPNVVAIILDMDTPGGEVTASDEIYREVRLCRKANLPVVTCMRSVGASGGYFVAAGSDWIVANRLTITGSIGVLIGTLNYSALLTKIGVESEVYKSGQMKDMLRGSRPRTDTERAYVQQLVDATYREFAAVVANGRTRYDTAEEVMASEFGDGRVLSGAEALRLGLVDQLGYFDDAVDKAKELAGVREARVVRYRRPLRLMDLFLGAQARSAAGFQALLPPEVQAIRPGRLYFLMPTALP